MVDQATQLTTDTAKTANQPEKKTAAGASSQTSKSRGPASQGGADQRTNKRHDDRRNKRGQNRQRRERPKPEFDHTVIDIRRVTRVMGGGRRFSFRVTVVAGDRNGRVGVGIGKSMDTPTAIDKAARDAKANMITVRRTRTNSIPCDGEAKYCGSQVLILPSPGRGIIAGSSVRPVLELSGVNDVTTKLVSRSKNKLNNAKAAIRVLENMPTPTGDDAKPVKTTASKK